MSKEDYLPKSPNNLPSKNRKHRNIISVLVFIIIWVISLIDFWAIMSPSDALGFSILFLFILIPVATFVSSLLISKNNYPSKLIWVCPIFFGIMYMLSEYLTFSLSNMIATEKFLVPQFSMILFGSIISLIGFFVGLLIAKIKNLSRIQK